MSSADNGILGGHPSSVTPTPPPWLSPQVLIRNSRPKLFPIPMVVVGAEAVVGVVVLKPVPMPKASAWRGRALHSRAGAIAANSKGNLIVGLDSSLCARSCFVRRLWFLWLLRGWVPAVLAVAALAWLSIKVLTPCSGVSRHRGSGDPDHDSTSRRSDSGGGDGDDESGTVSGQAASGDMDTGRGGVGGSPVDVGADETEDGDEEDYVVLTAEEIGPAIHSACSSAAFQECCAEVRKCWALLHPNHVEATCARMYELFRENDPVAASLFGEHVAWKQQHHVFTIMISTIIARSADPALLEETLRPLGEKHFALGVKETYFASMGEALVQAVKESLEKTKGSEVSFPPSAAAAWEAFFATISGCMMLAGGGTAPRRKHDRRRHKGEQRRSEPGVPVARSAAKDCIEDCSEEQSANYSGHQSENRSERHADSEEPLAVRVGWERAENGRPSYSLVRSFCLSTSSEIVNLSPTEMPRFPEKPAGGVEAVDGVIGMDTVAVDSGS